MNTSNKRIRYAVLGLGYMAQAEVLPSCERARKNSELVSLVSIEGWADVHIIRRLYQSAAKGAPMPLGLIAQDKPTTPKQRITRPLAKRPELVHAEPPSP